MMGKEKDGSLLKKQRKDEDKKEALGAIFGLIPKFDSH